MRVGRITGWREAKEKRRKMWTKYINEKQWKRKVRNWSTF